MVTMIVVGQTRAIVVCMTMADLALAKEVFTMTGPAQDMTVVTMTGLEQAMGACMATIGQALVTGACMTKADLGRVTEVTEGNSGASK